MTAPKLPRATRGQPIKSDHGPASSVLFIRVSQEEKKQWKLATKKARTDDGEKLNLSEWVISRLNTAAKQERTT